MEWNESYRSLSASALVHEAAEQTDRLVARTLETEGGNRDEAIGRISTQARVPRTVLRSLLQPSRRPKSLAGHWLLRIRGFYLAHLRKQLRALQLEIQRIEALEPSDGAAQACLDDAKALVAEIEALLDPAPRG